ncbi:MAG: hypothetical protein C3F08_10485 [Candidatus Methylomirabilota bacterium]|nr:MAG: hypothetical protein C3F08_10485 [candidate division NC10 bacterium]
MLRLARPFELRVQVRVVGVDLLFLPRVRVGVRRYQPDRRVVEPLFVLMFVRLNRPFHIRLLLSRHDVPPIRSVISSSEG